MCGMQRMSENFRLTKPLILHILLYRYCERLGTERVGTNPASERECHRLKAFSVRAARKCIRELIR